MSRPTGAHIAGNAYTDALGLQAHNNNWGYFDNGEPYLGPHAPARAVQHAPEVIFIPQIVINDRAPAAQVHAQVPAHVDAWVQQIGLQDRREQQQQQRERQAHEQRNAQQQRDNEARQRERERQERRAQEQARRDNRALRERAAAAAAHAPRPAVQPPVAAAPLPARGPPVLIAAHEIVRGTRLGGGSFGDVFRAAWRGQPVALKCLRMPASLTQSERARLLRQLVDEVNAMSALHSPHILRCYGWTQEPEFAVVMELAHGSLAAFLLSQRAAGGVPLHTQYEVSVGIARGLAALHSIRTAHRDLKPDNIMCDARASLASVKLGDLGCAHVRDSNSLMSTLAGTPNFMAPEVMRGEQYGVSADIWSLGCCLFQVATGELPFHHLLQIPRDRGQMVSPPHLLQQRIGREGAALRFPAGVEPALREVIEACTRHAAAERPTAREALAQLEFLLESSQGGAQPQRPAQQAVQRAGAGAHAGPRSPQARGPAGRAPAGAPARVVAAAPAAAAGAADAAVVGAERECLICYDAPRCVVALPCSHNVCCAACLRQLRAQAQQRCPVCRAAVQHWAQVQPGMATFVQV